VTAPPPPPREVAGQVVFAGSAGGSIYDLGYRRYLGPRLGRRHAAASLMRHSLRQAFGLGRPARSKVIPIGLLVIAFLPAVVALGFAALAARLAGPGALIDEANPITYASYASMTAQVLALFTAAQAPELLGRDLRYRVVALYFTRALRRDDYALAKLGAMAIAMLIVTLVPHALILVGRALVATDVVGGIAEDLPMMAPVLAQSLLTAGLLASLGLAVASFSPRRAFATTGIIAFLIIPPIVVAVATELLGTRWLGPLSLLSPPNLLDATNAVLFDTGETRQLARVLPLVAYPLAAMAWIAGATAVLVRRYRRLEP
jgi:ABC-2 type transport system permease protein